jgi:hypothetical protein
LINRHDELELVRVDLDLAGTIRTQRGRRVAQVSPWRYRQFKTLATNLGFQFVGGAGKLTEGLTNLY